MNPFGCHFATQNQNTGGGDVAATREALRRIELNTQGIPRIEQTVASSLRANRGPPGSADRAQWRQEAREENNDDPFLGFHAPQPDVVPNNNGMDSVGNPHYFPTTGAGHACTKCKCRDGILYYCCASHQNQALNNGCPPEKLLEKKSHW